MSEPIIDWDKLISKYEQLKQVKETAKEVIDTYNERPEVVCSIDLIRAIKHLKQALK